MKSTDKVGGSADRRQRTQLCVVLAFLQAVQLQLICEYNPAELIEMLTFYIYSSY